MTGRAHSQNLAQLHKAVLHEPQHARIICLLPATDPEQTPHLMASVTPTRCIALHAKRLRNISEIRDSSQHDLRHERHAPDTG